MVVTQTGLITGTKKEPVGRKISKKILINSIVSKLKLKKNDKLLDVGCGVGILTVEFKKYAGEVVGIDASPFMLKRVSSGIKTYLAEASKMPFPDQEFDKIFCHSIFQYFPNLDCSF